MTMQQVLDGIHGLDERFREHAARLKALERETGMVDSDDPDDDEAKKKAEEAMADDGRSGQGSRQVHQDATALHWADHDQGRNAQGCQGQGQTSPQWQIREHRRQPQPGPEPEQTRRWGMTVGAMLRSALSGASKTGYRELEVLEENHITYDRDHLVVPWDFLAEYGRHATKVERKLESWEPKEIQAGYVRQVYDTIGKDGHVRTITSAGSSGAGAVGVDLDVARS